MQQKGWPVIHSGHHALLLAPTGSGKTLAAFLAAIDHLMFAPQPPRAERCRVLYISPLKALAVDVERNLRAPVAGIARMAERSGVPFMLPTSAIRTGDTPAAERVQFARNPADILITTPESLYLMLTSNVREVLRSIRWVIVDEIHAVAATKRGSHLALSLERLEVLLEKPFQRIGLSATQRPLEEIAQFLGGGEPAARGKWKPRPVTIVDAGGRKQLDIRVTVPVEDMSRLGEVLEQIPSGPAAQGPSRRSIWPALYPQVLDLIRKHRTTLIFVNNRRLAERMAAMLNELAGDEIARAHHGSVAREQRQQIEEDLKAGRLPAIVATSSLELGIDMGSIDLVVQVEAPASVSSALQRIGRAGHQAGASSEGVVFPKFRGDLIACAALTKLMLNGEVEETRYPRNPLDVLSQQIVAMASMDTWSIHDLERTVRSSAPFANLTRHTLESVLDMLSGRYPSDEFGDLRPRITWDRIAGRIRARQGAKTIAISSGGTIPDRGLYGAFLVGADPGKGRVGELDEEMVFETRVGERFVLGATTWRVEEITHNRVLVSPAPGEEGKMPFWKGDAAGRSPDFGRAIGAFIRKVRKLQPVEARRLLMEEYRLDDWAANNLLAYLKEQVDKTGEVPDDRTIVVERYSDDLGDWRICILSPFGARVHAPWIHAIESTIRRKIGMAVETMWSDDGMILRFSETDDPPSLDLLLPDPEEVEGLVMEQLGASSLFAARFRESAARALLLPRRYPGQRTPLWQQRKRATDLLQVTSRYRDFPIILETYREVLRDFFDMPALTEILRDIRNRKIRVAAIQTRSASPFAASLMFGYVGNFMYDGDAPLAERRALALSVDPSQLRELLGESELRELLDPDVIDLLELQLQHLEESRRARHADGIHDLLLRLGDLSAQEIEARCAVPASVKHWLKELDSARRAVEVSIAGARRWIAAEDTGRYRDALGTLTPSGLPDAFLEKVADPLGDLLSRYARTHGPFHGFAAAERFGLGAAPVQQILEKLEQAGRVVQGQFRAGRTGQEWCDAGVLRAIRQKSLAKLRREVEPVEPPVYGRFLTEWHRIGAARKGPDALLEVIEQLQGYPIPASVLESQVLPARLQDYDSRDLDSLMASGLVVWSGVEPIGQTDGRIALYLSEHAAQLLRPPEGEVNHEELHDTILEFLDQSGASFFPRIAQVAEGAFKPHVLSALWDLVWAGEVTNDTLAPLRALLVSSEKHRKRGRAVGIHRGAIPPEAAGRWSLVRKIVAPHGGIAATPTERLAATSQQLLDRLGVVTREAIAAERISGGFSAVYPVLKVMEEAGRIRRGYFIAGRGAAQFALPGALERLRGLREPEECDPVMLAATDPANPYGAALPWPDRTDAAPVGRMAGASVILVNGRLAAFLGRGERNLLTFVSDDDADAEILLTGIARALAAQLESGHRRAVFIAEVDGNPPGRSRLAQALEKQGFVAYPHGWQKRREEPDA